MKRTIRRGIPVDYRNRIDAVGTSLVLCRCPLCCRDTTIDIASQVSTNGRYLSRSEYEMHQAMQPQTSPGTPQSLAEPQTHYHPLPQPRQPPLTYDLVPSDRNIDEDLSLLKSSRETFRRRKQFFTPPVHLVFELPPSAETSLSSENDTQLTLIEHHPDNICIMEYEAFLRVSQAVIRQCQPERSAVLRITSKTFSKEIADELIVLQRLKAKEWEQQRQEDQIRDIKYHVDTGKWYAQALAGNTHQA